MDVNPLTPMGAATVPHRLVVHIEFAPPVLVLPAFANDAAWLRLLAPALERSGVSSDDLGITFVLIRLLLPAREGGGFAAEPEPIGAEVVDAVVDALATRGFQTSANGVNIREEAHERETPLLEVSIYAEEQR